MLFSKYRKRERSSGGQTYDLSLNARLHYRLRYQTDVINGS